MEGGIILKSGMNFLIVFRRNSGKAIPKDRMEKAERMFDISFASHTALAKGVYLATGLNETMFRPSSCDIIAEIRIFVERVMRVALSMINIDDAGVSVSMIAPVFGSTSQPTAGPNMFEDIERIMENGETVGESRECRGWAPEPPETGETGESRPKTKADRWLDELLGGMAGEGGFPDDGE